MTTTLSCKSVGEDTRHTSYLVLSHAVSVRQSRAVIAFCPRAMSVEERQGLRVQLSARRIGYRRPF